MASAIINAVHVSPSSPFWPSPDAAPEFEFRLAPSAAMLPADELFAGGFLLPLHLRPAPPPEPEPESSSAPSADPSRSPKAPRCSSRWKELFGLKRAAQRAASHRPANPSDPKPRRPKPPPASDAVPLLRDHDAAAAPRASASGLPAERPRASVDSTPARAARFAAAAPGEGRTGRTGRREISARCLSVDSPRMSSSGRVVFQNLGRSSSSPGSFGGGGGAARRSFSGATVSPVLNVPAAFGFTQLFASPQRKDATATTSAAAAGNSRALRR